MFDNEYECDNPLQKAWESLSTTCLCTMRESCSSCDGSGDSTKALIKELAKSQGYQLYYKKWRSSEYTKELMDN